MHFPYHGSQQDRPNVTGTVYERLGGELSAVDPWTSVDAKWLDVATRTSRDAVGYRGLTAAFRVAGLTLGDADAAPMCPPFLVEILPDRLVAQVSMRDGARHYDAPPAWPAAALQHWAAGSLSKDLRVMAFEDGDVVLEATIHLGASSNAAALRAFVTAFSWDVAALHAAESGLELLTTEEWVKRAALSISRSTPAIPLRAHPTPSWHADESPTGVFCSLQPGGALAESDNVLYAVRRDAAVLEAIVPMPGHRSDWDYARLTDVWLSQDGQTALARTLLCAAVVHSGGAGWRALDSDAISAVSPFGAGGFVLGLHDGRVLVVGAHGALQMPAVRLGRVRRRFTRVVTRDTRVVGLAGDMIVSARLEQHATRWKAADAWQVRLAPDLSLDQVADIDIDGWAQLPCVAVLADDVIAWFDAEQGHAQHRIAAPAARLARWIGAGMLLVVSQDPDDDARSQLRVLHVGTQRWTEPLMVSAIARLAVRGDEIHVGYANQTVAVWDRLEVCHALRAQTAPWQAPGEPGTGVEPAPRSQPARHDAVRDRATRADNETM